VARYLYKRLVHRYTYADMINTYHFRFTAIRGAGMLDSYSSRVDKQRPVVKAAFDELARLGVIRESYEVKLHYTPQGRRSIEDATYTVAATKQFVTEQKAASRRSKDAAAHRLTPTPRRAPAARKPARVDLPLAEVPWGIA